MLRILALAAAIAAVSLNTNAYFEPTQTGAKPREMNGIFFDEHKDFTKKWNLVTVRYRQDSGEQRMVYANDLAFEALKKLKPDFPDGSMFAKVAFATEDDPAFPSSKTPAGAKRYQFMLKNKKKYAKSDGWAYALFDDQGNLFDEDMKAKTDSCVACHRLVPHRDFVFSRQMILHQDQFTAPITPESSASLVTFETIKIAAAPSEMKSFLKKYDYVNSLTGPLQKSAFSGTLDEVIPLLSQKAKATNAPSALIVDEKNFSLVVPLPKSRKCTNESRLKAMRIILQFNSRLVRDAEACL